MNFLDEVDVEMFPSRKYVKQILKKSTQKIKKIGIVIFSLCVKIKKDHDDKYPCTIDL